MNYIHGLIMVFAMSSYTLAQSIVSVDAFDEQGNNPSQLTLRLKLTNNTSDTLKNIRARYFLNYERDRVLNVSPYYMSGATTSIDTLDEFLAVNIEISKLAPGVFPNVSGISLGMNYTDYKSFNKQNNFSYPGAEGFVTTNNISIDVNDSLIAGSTPIDNEISKIRFVGIQPEKSNTRSAWVELENYGETDIDINDYFLKWSVNDSVGIDNLTLPSGKKIRICQTSDSLECPSSDMILIKKDLPFGEKGLLGIFKNGVLLHQIVWNNSNKIISENLGPNFSLSIIPYDIGNISSEGIFIQKKNGIFFSLINGIWISHRAIDINNENKLPSPVPFAEEIIVYDSSSLYRFAWHPVKNVEEYILTVKTDRDSIVYQGKIHQNYAELVLTDSLYFWNVQNDDGEASFDNLVWNKIVKSSATVNTEHLLGVPAFGARKDTKMLVLNWGEKINVMPWDKPNDMGIMTEEEETRCSFISIHMMNAYYRGSLTQDEIKYHGKVAAFSNIRMEQENQEYLITRQQTENIISPFRLGSDGGGMPYETKATLAWALNIMDSEIEAEFSPEEGVISILTESIVKKYIDAQRPLLVSIGNHAMVIDGYDFHDNENKKVHFLNTDNSGSELWSSLDTWKYRYYYVPKNEINGRWTDYRIHKDSDADGIVDFDEIERFKTDPYNVDSDGDGVDDKSEIVSYIMKEPFKITTDGKELYLGNQSVSITGTSYDKMNVAITINRTELFADVDGDGKRAELDVDSDYATDGGTWDGDEVSAGTNPFDPSDDSFQSAPSVVKTEWDAPADITIYSLDVLRVNDRTICYDGDGYCKIASESSRTNFAINVGVESVVGDIYSRGGVWLRILANAKGNISIYSKPINNLSVNTQDQASFDGTESHLNFKDWPYSINDGEETLFSYVGNPGNLIVTNGEEKKLNNGDEYQMVKVESGGSLKIGPGKMKIGMIQLESGSSITFTNPGQKTVVWTNGKTLWRTVITNENQNLVAKGFKLIQLSNKDMFIEGDWAGTIHAAKAYLVMGQAKKLIYGRFVGKTITFHQNSRVYRVDYDPIVPALDVVLR